MPAKNHSTGVRYSLDEYDRLMEIVQESGFKQKLQKEIKAPAYTRLLDAKSAGFSGTGLGEITKQQYLKGRFSILYRAAREKMLSESPALQERIRQRRIKLLTDSPTDRDVERILTSQAPVKFSLEEESLNRLEI